MARIALCDASGPLTDLLQKLSGDEGAAWLQRLNKFLRNETNDTTQAVVKYEFPKWKTVKIGTYKNAKELSKVLNANGFRIGDWAMEVLKKMPVAETETEIELVPVTVADLGFTKATRRDAIYDRAKELGLDLVPAEVGPQLRLAYSDQPMGEWMLIAMEPIVGARNPDVFFVANDKDGQWLSADYGSRGHRWSPGHSWIFARRKGSFSKPDHSDHVVFPLTVNYDRPVEDSVKAGNYYWANDSITTKNFPSERKGSADLEIILVKFKKDVEFDDVVKHLDKQGLRPAELPELLALGEKYLDLQRDYPIAALGSVWQCPEGNRLVPSLRRDFGRDLELDWVVSGWTSTYRFAAVRK